MEILDPITITDAILVSSNVPENDYPVYDATRVYEQGDYVTVTTPDVHKIYQQAQGVTHAVTITVATPCVVNWVGHGLPAGRAVRLKSTGTLPTGLSANTTYYVLTPGADTFQLGLVAGGSAIATTGAGSGVHTIITNDLGKSPVTEPTYWTLKTATNRWAMFDRYNNTVTENPDSIEIELTPNGVCCGLNLAGIDGDELTITVTDAVEGLVFDQTYSLLLSDSRSSFYRWGFQKIKRRKTFTTIDLPPYKNATISITISKPGDVAKCAMCNLGPLDHIADTEFGFGASFKDYSTTTFNIDGDPNTVLRPWVKTLSIPISMKSGVTQSAYDQVMNYRQRFVVFIGTGEFELASAYGRMVGFKITVPGRAISTGSLDIDGGI